MNLNEAKTILANNGYLVESIEGYDELCQYLNEEDIKKYIEKLIHKLDKK